MGVAHTSDPGPFVVLNLENKHQSSWRRMLPVGFSEIPCRKLVLLCCIRFLVAGTKYRTPTSRGGSSFSGPGLGGIHPWWAGSEPSRGGRVPPGQPWGHGAESRSAGWFRGGGKQGPGREHRTGRGRGPDVKVPGAGGALWPALPAQACVSAMLQASPGPREIHPRNPNVGVEFG